MSMVGLTRAFMAVRRSAERRARNDADAAEICGEDQCGEVGNGEGSREVGKGFDQAVKSCIRILGRATPTD